MSFDEAHPHGYLLSDTVATLFYLNVMCTVWVVVVCALCYQLCVCATPTETQLAQIITPTQTDILLVAIPYYLYTGSSIDQNTISLAHWVTFVGHISRSRVTPTETYSMLNYIHKFRYTGVSLWLRQHGMRSLCVIPNTYLSITFASYQAGGLDNNRLARYATV